MSNEMIHRKTIRFTMNLAMEREVENMCCEEISD